MSGFRLLLEEHLPAVCKLDQEQLRTLESHYELLQRWNTRINLTSLRGLEEIVVRHYCESLALAAALPNGPLRIVDIGSGAGFPGFPIAVYRKDCQVTLVESSGKKAVFLREATRGLDNISVVERRAAAIRHHFDWAVSRGVRWESFLDMIPGLADHLALLVGQRDADELGKRKGFIWSQPTHLPGGKKRLLIMGTVSRDTSPMRSRDSRST